MKNQILTARLPPEIINGIDEFQRKQNLAFRTDALIEIVKVACSAVGIDLSNIPVAPASPVETQGTSEEETEPNEWLCPTGRMGGYARCEQRSKQEPEECKACKAIPKYYREILFPEEEEAEEEPKEKPDKKPITQKLPAIPEKPLSTTATPIIAPQPQEPSVPETVGDSDLVVQQAAYIKALRERSKKELRGQQKLGEE